GLGNDIYIVDSADDIVIEQANEGIDEVISSIDYTLVANVDNLSLTGVAALNGTGNELSNRLQGNASDNRLDGQGGVDYLWGLEGNDTYVVDNTGDYTIELFDQGVDTVESSVTFTLQANVENLTLIGTAAINGTGNSLDNTLVGNSGANVLAGGLGNDTYVIGVGDSIVEHANEGMDTVVSGASYTLGDHLENLTLTGTAAIDGTGNALNNILVGNSGANTLAGGDGDDTYVVGAGDTIVESKNGGIDTVQSEVTWTLDGSLEHLTLIGTSAIDGTGNNGSNILIGNSAANVLDASGGADTLRGGAGDDIVNGGKGNDTYLFGRGDGQDLLQDSGGGDDKILYDAGINPIDLVISRQGDDLRLAIHGSTDSVTVQNWYSSSSNRTETIQAGAGEVLLSSQVDQLIQAMAQFTTDTGLSWDAAAGGAGTAQQQAQFQGILAANWQ
ncbi:MAG: hypothetical protein OEY86_21045, partial [Nitrospira sp.]|nr:hypothetical protein [Nitrospira sp.]